ncbi:MAG: GNAT family N-acetyltransferase [Verrucomicrobia bacterium]|nr:GNAT family N-acetyltransferase [Verrucomicrobiota bacterium]MBV8278486.1 GNAT family N-acetyltransferase [Verrucomicrobiota bacterium]
MKVPTLETERLVLRAHRLKDFSDCAALWANPVVTRFIGGIPLTPEDTWSRLLRNAGHWLLLGFGYWVVEEKATGNFLGEVGFADLKRSIEPPLGNTPEAGWVFAPSAHGKGFALEAVQAIHMWGAENFQTRNSACLIAPENEASLRLAAKIGYRESSRSVYKGQPAIIFFRNW